MGTTIRPEITQRHQYWLDRHRYYELKHFCLQYPLWKKEYHSLDGYCKSSTSVVDISGQNGQGDPTATYAEARVYFGDRIQMVDDAAAEASDELSSYILCAVTEGRSYEYMAAVRHIPCCRETYYELYRRFFWLLSRSRK